MLSTLYSLQWRHATSRPFFVQLPSDTFLSCFVSILWWKLPSGYVKKIQKLISKLKHIEMSVFNRNDQYHQNHMTVSFPIRFPTLQVNLMKWWDHWNAYLFIYKITEIVFKANLSRVHDIEFFIFLQNFWCGSI